jgi:hypothetical protein
MWFNAITAGIRDWRNGVDRHFAWQQLSGLNVDPSVSKARAERRNTLPHGRLSIKRIEELVAISVAL